MKVMRMMKGMMMTMMRKVKVRSCCNLPVSNMNTEPVEKLPFFVSVLALNNLAVFPILQV